ncbi:restriction endonuclease subunit S [Salegentibacter salinarum]|uniref:Restriction endonuclease subunit S n=1 Tax=Salegentibacter salinarum TaxID=447422 RepID=A0A2N0TS95_9FLAO|nr:restriction endonuclease subunit S [Salegentibacter salinarum]PKD17614.1 restriction endonuclease subunit S [Salegentibacter salinarum]SKB49674.1 type I restriction enzyme, S subunit [Salegentibacter salinarum]
MEAVKEKPQLQKYPAYKDSGVEWLEEVPEHWELRRLGSRFEERKTKVSDKDFPPLSVTKNGIFPQLDNAAKSNDGDNRKLVKKGDFVINSRSDRKGSSGISDLDGSVSLINIVMKPYNLYGPFSNYLLKSTAFVEENYRIGHGIVADLWTTRFDELKNIKAAFPPFDEQTAIAHFLDEKCGKIDTAITQKQQLIELLKKRKQIIIQNAVTKGLDPNVKMKESDVEWIGQIPVHWEVKKLKHSAALRSDKTVSKFSTMNYLGLENIESWTGNLIETDSETEGQANCFKVGDVLFGKLRPYLAKVLLAKKDGICSGEILAFNANEEVYNSYLHKVMLSYRFIDLIDSSTYGAKMPRANPTFIKHQIIPIPGFDEQQEIVKYINDQVQKSDKTIDFQRQQIEKLKEYKSSLIDAAVTGKIKVS